MEHTGMARMFKTLENIGLKGFLKASRPVYEAIVVEFFANAKVVAGMVVSFVTNRKLALTKGVFAETFGLPTEGMTSFLDIPTHTVVDMRRRFSVSDVPFRANKNKEMKMEYILLHEIVAKALCAKASSLDMVTREKFDLMVAISSIAGDAANVDLPQITWSEALKSLLPRDTPAQPVQPKVLALEFSTQEEQEQAATKRPAQQAEQIMDNTAKDLTSLKDSVSSMDLKVEHIKADTDFARRSTMQLRQQLETSADKLEIR
ncbi:hypothetical protein F511_32936 [Dorcoceras hygrometricum]|uniref:Uncharacterized protein n=1 Tax=Dorcoceras hygrometricum TaxID=472368 RepID=A0A2Z7BW38_9LAMI|nr:hypothetical protein F511_32936 [Dorcoceras hygrometricum]